MTFEREVAYLSAAELGRGYRAKQFSAGEVTEALLDRIARLDPTLRAFITVTADLAREQARAADRALAKGDDRPLLGIPIALKDLFATKGVRTTGGSMVFWNTVPRADAECFTRLRAAGAVLLGKLTMHELAYGWPVKDGPLATGRNPWDASRIPAGSSSGCGVAAAAGLATITLGSDTGGSIRGPANNCGVVGLKPTYGRVSVRGVIPLSWSLDHVGPICRTVEDAALVLQSIAGPDPADPLCSSHPVPDHLRSLDEGAGGVRIGVPGDRMFRTRAPDPEIVAAQAEMVAALRGAGASIRTVDLPEPARWQPVVNAIMADAYTYHEGRLRREPEKFSPGLRQLLYALAPYSASDVIHAHRLRQRIAAEIRDLFRELDLVVMPVEFYLPITFEQSQEELTSGTRPPSLRSLWDLVGLPALSVPCGFSRAGLPIGMQIVARPFDEPLLLRVAHAYERMTDWRTRHPALDQS